MVRWRKGHVLHEVFVLRNLFSTTRRFYLREDGVQQRRRDVVYVSLHVFAVCRCVLVVIRKDLLEAWAVGFRICENWGQEFGIDVVVNLSGDSHFAGQMRGRTRSRLQLLTAIPSSGLNRAFELPSPGPLRPPLMANLELKRYDD